VDQRFYDAVSRNPVIAAVKNYDELEHCLVIEEIQIVFVLFGNICDIKDIIHRIKAAGKYAMIHIDLVEGLSGKDVVVDFIHQETEADGIISTRPNLIHRAHELHMCNILRIFIIDSKAFASLESLNAIRPDFIEILPGIIPKVIHELRAVTSIPIMVGGLITSKGDVIRALDAGAIAISSSNQDVWRM